MATTGQPAAVYLHLFRRCCFVFVCTLWRGKHTKWVDFSADGSTVKVSPRTLLWQCSHHRKSRLTLCAWWAACSEQRDVLVIICKFSTVPFHFTWPPFRGLPTQQRSLFHSAFDPEYTCDNCYFVHLYAQGSSHRRMPQCRCTTSSKVAKKHTPSHLIACISLLENSKNASCNNAKLAKVPSLTCKSPMLKQKKVRNTWCNRLLTMT